MINKRKLYDDLIMSFINYQWRLENPMPLPEESQESMIKHYQADYLFRNRVQALAGHIMGVVDSHLEVPA